MYLLPILSRHWLRAVIAAGLCLLRANSRSVAGGVGVLLDSGGLN